MDIHLVGLNVVRANVPHEEQEQQQEHVEQADRRCAPEERLVLAEQVEHEVQRHRVKWARLLLSENQIEKTHKAESEEQQAQVLGQQQIRWRQHVQNRFVLDHRLALPLVVQVVSDHNALGKKRMTSE